MLRVILSTCLLLAAGLSGNVVLAKDPVQLALHKSARIGVLNMLDGELAHFHVARAREQSFFKTYPVNWQIDSMLSDAVVPRLTQLELVAVTTGPTDKLARGRDDFFVNSSPAKGLSKPLSRELADLATQQRLDALIVFAPGLNNSAQSGGNVRKGLPDYIRGWGFVTTEGSDKPELFDMTQILLVEINSDGAVLRAREWGGSYYGEWPNYTAPADLKRLSVQQLDQLQPEFVRILKAQAGKVLDWITVVP